ncbi:MAG: molybdopterin-dependent oxidoreductase [Chloroflexota bacterium]
MTNTPSNKKPSRVSRRGFLIAITGSAVAAAAGCRPDGLVPPTPYSPGSGPRPTGTAGPTATNLPARADATYGEVTFDKIFLTDPDKLYITQFDYSHTPEVDVKSWALKIDGLVENPITLDYNAVKALPAFEDMRTLECIGNPVGGSLIGNLNWKGFAFEEILKQVKVKPTATHLKFEAADGYSTSVELKWVTQPGVMMAYEMNGQPLTVKHGFPIRINMPGLYGQKMPRWITHMEFIDSYYKGFWESHGWSDVANVQTNSIIKGPSDSYSTAAGTTLAIQGVAYANPREITKVEVQVDNGEWMPASLTHGESPRAWTQWYLKWTPPAPGSYRIGVRATDESGFVQVNDANGIFGDSAPDGTTAIHRITVQAT